MNFNPEIDEFFSRIRDTEIFHLLPALKRRMMHAIEQHPPHHLDDWEPPSVLPPGER
jgi:hypothetical protein